MGLAAAGAAGALASPALTGQAAAANGDGVILGQANSATSTTAVTRASGAGPAVQLGNSGDGAPLRLGETPLLGVTTVDAGDVLYSTGFFSVGWAAGEEALVHESSYATYPELFSPFRLLDTRYAAATSTGFGRSRVTNPTGKFDASGRLKSGQTINVRLDDFSFLAVGIIANFSVTGPLNAGYLKVWDTGSPAPNASALNYATNQTIGNASTVAAGFDTADNDSISIAAVGGTTHVIVDISGLVISSPFNLNWSGAPAAVPATASAERAGRAASLKRR